MRGALLAVLLLANPDGGVEAEFYDTACMFEPDSSEKDARRRRRSDDDSGALLEVIAANKTAFAKCAEASRKKEPSVTGKLVVQWTIEPNGKPSNVSVQTDQLKSTYFATCITGVIERLRFSRRKTASEPVRFPFHF